MKRFECLRILSELVRNELVVTTIGATPNEWEMLHPDDGNFYASGMGAATPCGLGLAIALPNRRVIVLESDGSLLFNLGTLTTVALQKPKNLRIFVFDNESYESAGQGLLKTPTSRGIDLLAIAESFGIHCPYLARTIDTFRDIARKALQSDELSFVVAKTEVEKSKVPARRIDGVEVVYRFLRHMGGDEDHDEV